MEMESGKDEPAEVGMVKEHKLPKHKLLHNTKKHKSSLKE